MSKQVRLVTALVVLLYCQKAFLTASTKEIAADPEYLEKLFSEGKYEEFGKLLKIYNVEIIKPLDGESPKDLMFHKELEYGDILIRPEQEEARQGLNFDTLPDSKWGKYIPYTIISSNYTAVQKGTITRAIIEWNKAISEVRWRQKTNEDKNYVVFFSGNGCYSNLGMVGGAQGLSLSPGCLRTGTIHHEMMHVVGFTHEHNRPDRDDYIRLLPKNIDPDWLGSYEKKSPHYFSLVGPYDYYSILHYSVLEPETNKPAFRVLRAGIDEDRIGQRDAMTPEDLQKIREMYV